MKAQLMHLPGSQHASPLQLWSRASTPFCDRVRNVDAAVGDDHYFIGMRATCAWLLVVAGMTERISAHLAHDKLSLFSKYGSCMLLAGVCMCRGRVFSA